MEQPRIPEDESARLKALLDTGLLDSLPEERFDRLTRLAQQMFRVPIALVSLVDQDRQWFKSRQGLDACETGRDISFCGHAILDNPLFIIENALEDERFRDNPLVLGPPSIRFYAGAPLKTESGHRIGTLCIIDDKPRSLNEDERAALMDIAGCVEDQLSNALQQKLVLQKRLSLANDAAGVGIWDWDVVANDLQWDAQMYRLYGIKPEQFDGAYSAWQSALHPEDTARSEQAINDALNNVKAFDICFRVIWPTGEIRFIQAAAHIERDIGGNPLRMIGTNWDVTHQKIAEHNLVLAKEAAEVATRAKSAFLANMSHEIRTPMNIILGMTRQAIKLSADERQRDLLSKVNVSANHLLGIINDILDISKIESGKIKLEHLPWSLSEFAERLGALIKEQAQTDSIEFNYALAPNCPSVLLGDSQKIQQILLNLLGNAIKFSPKHSKVELNVTCDELKRKPALRFDIIDNGIGISEEQQKRLFKPFSQADESTTRKFGGTGFGLSISLQLAKLMGGDIQLSSKLNQGSAFSLFIPIESPQNTPTLEQIQTEKSDAIAAQVDTEEDDFLAAFASLKGKRILLVEDTTYNQELAAMLLEDVECEFTIANNGKEAIQKLEKGQYDAVLMDCQMPIMDGYEATREIRKRPQWKSLPVIAMTAHALSDDKKTAMDAGMDDYLTKPIDDELLYTTLQKWT